MDAADEPTTDAGIDATPTQDEMTLLEHELAREKGPRRREVARRLHRLQRQAAEAAPDALFQGTDAHGLRGALRRSDSYGFVLLMLVGLIWVFVPLAGAARWTTLPTSIVFYFTILISLHTSFIREGRLRAAIIANTALIALSLVGYVTDNDDLRGAADLGFAILLFITAVVILRRILGHRAITSRTLSGAVSVMLFIGLGFAAIATTIELWAPGSYAANTGELGFSSMLYFSFVTLTTLGYGDINPVTDFARSMATFEAILGQIYLVTIVARLVTLLGQTRTDPGGTTPS